MKHLNVATARLRAGLCVLPARIDSKRPALSRWKEFQQRLPTEDEIAAWFTDSAAICIVAGAVSGNLEMLDFDAGGTAFDAWAELVTSEAPGLLERLVIERSPSGGRHVVYRCASGVSTNIKLAHRRVIAPSPEAIVLHGKSYVPRRVGDQYEVILTLIETRGEGGLFLCDPTPGYELVQGNFLAVPEVSEAERELLLRAAWSLDELPPVMAPDPGAGDPCGRPGDDFNERGDVRAVLLQHGWTCVRPGDNEYWRRPGKDNGWSATLRGGVFYVFSANAAPFEPNRGYSPFGVYARLEHNGDFRAAASALRSQGFGQAVEPWRPTATGAEPRNRWAPDLVCLADVAPQAVVWLWYRRIPLGRITLLVGRPGAGKSFLVNDLAARVSTGSHWPDPGFDCAPIGDTLMICAEDDPADTIRPRLDAAGANCRRVHMLRAAKVIEDDGSERSVAFDLSNVELIRDAIDRLPECRLVVIDPIGSYLGGQTDCNRDNEVRSILAPLAALAAERGVAVLLVCHTRKALASYADDMTLGSRAFVGLARSVLHLMADPDDEKRKLLLPGKCNLSAPAAGLAFRIVGDPGRLEWEPDPLDGIRADDVVAPKESKEAKRGPEPTTRDSAAEWLSELLKDGPLPVAVVREHAKAADLSWRTIRRARELLGIIPRKKAFGDGWEWGLPEGGHPAAEGGHVPRRCPSNEKLGHLRENTGEKGQNCLDFAEDDQVSRNLDTFEKNLSTFEETWPPSRITDTPADPDLMPMRPDDAKLQEPGNLGLAADDVDSVDDPKTVDAGDGPLQWDQGEADSLVSMALRVYRSAGWGNTSPALMATMAAIDKAFLNRDIKGLRSAVNAYLNLVDGGG